MQNILLQLLNQLRIRRNTIRYYEMQDRKEVASNLRHILMERSPEWPEVCGSRRHRPGATGPVDRGGNLASLVTSFDGQSDFCDPRQAF